MVQKVSKVVNTKRQTRQPITRCLSENSLNTNINKYKMLENAY